MNVRQRGEMERADELAIGYLRNKEMLDSLSRSQTTAKARIKSFTFKSALKTVIGRETLVFGRRFVVGFLKTDGSKTIDYEKLFLMRPKLRKKVCRFVPVPE